VTLARGRVIPAEALGAVELEASPPAPPAPRTPRGRVEPREVVEAAARADAIVQRASAEARGIVERARREAAEVRLRAESEGRADGAAAVAAQALRLAACEARADERGLERSVALARVLAERLLGEELALDPARVAALARQALAEARGARRVQIVAHPEDARALESSLGALGLEPSSARVLADPARRRGDLRLETDVGVLDADLAPQLDRLALKLRGSG
jgi:flagellar biosynthesis/type III secretory pathway protein FliH